MLGLLKRSDNARRVVWGHLEQLYHALCAFFQLYDANTLSIGGARGKPVPQMALAITSALMRLATGSATAYTSSVIAAEECPSTEDTVFTSTPDDMATVA